jgi:carbon-monoxide dehydrogenase small subunit
VPSVSLTVNGRQVTAEVEGRTLLVKLLRENLRLTGTHIGCDTTQCGACTVLFNSDAVKSCTVLAMQAHGAEVVTIEGVGSQAQLHPVQEAFRDKHALQCGFCTPGMVMNAIDLLQKNPNPLEHDIRHWLEGNLCRCTGYHNIVKAVLAAAEAMTASPDTTG